MAIDHEVYENLSPGIKTHFTVIECSEWGPGSSNFVYVHTYMCMCKYTCMHTCDAQSIGSFVMLIGEHFTLVSPL